jgi:trans-aconitate methyltransferase
MTFENVYEDPRRAQAYAKLEFPGTYYLAFRDLPALITTHATGKAAIDFGCGTGRSTRFLKKLGFHTIGADISSDMLKLARSFDPDGDYRLVTNDTLAACLTGQHDLVLSAFTFDNIPGFDTKVSLFRQLAQVLSPTGVLINLVSSPDIYTHEWASFSTKDFAYNFTAKTGDRVSTIMTDVDDRRPVDDIFWPDEAYQRVYAAASLKVLDTHRPLGREEEPIAWVNETSVAPWVIYILKSR